MNTPDAPAIAVHDLSKFFVAANGQKTRALEKVNLLQLLLERASERTQDDSDQ